MAVSQAHELTANEALSKIRSGLLSSVDLVKACLKRIEETDGQLRAWAHVDAERALARAEEMDAMRKSGRAVGPLHGIPVGLKDIIDTQDMPTECGTPIFAGRQPDADAALVERLTEAGAVILGKTVTTPFAYMVRSETRNPHNIDRTPGGSSSGSAASVAAFQVPVAVGTQTNGSVIRPASFCGTFGFKPSRGVISRRGLLQTSENLDQVGVFGRGLEDVALLAEALGGYDPADTASFARPRPGMLAGCRSEAPVGPVFASLDFPFSDRLDDDAEAGLEEVVSTLGSQVERPAVPSWIGELIETHRRIYEYELVRHLAVEIAENRGQLGKEMDEAVTRGSDVTDDQYEQALEAMRQAGAYFEAFFRDYDAIIMPGAPGQAPPFESGTGDPVFCTIASLCGLPSLTLPLLVGANGLPVGVQLVGAAEEDDRLLRTANWLLKFLQSSAD